MYVVFGLDAGRVPLIRRSLKLKLQSAAYICLTPALFSAILVCIIYFLWIKMCATAIIAITVYRDVCTIVPSHERRSR